MFDAFPRLPLELRIRIWESAVFPRMVYLPQLTKQMLSTHLRVQPTTSWPPVMLVCHESRQYANYQQFHISGPESRPTWINLAADMVCIAWYDFLEDPFPQHRSQIQRLQIDLNIDDYSPLYFRRICHQIMSYPNLTDLRFIVSEPLIFWGLFFKDRDWYACAAENISLVCPVSGLVLTGDQLDMSVEWRRKRS
ncbi:uncharacterized protein K489DRAFT_63197 [Dissoconium aciculare CBS 342.82]|uniref:2EXR domain-containing protein n=1 Tax=Dissoconium aciculare CBS 342.82 TaxID=1314786 RepID=A0A6J3LWE6_9PEZI|nr:uncharacterized protein K489DRAFT_63197 [Dissoconium aciculare CBS 342.82]KAF1819978.1 hypothetical protein K489DRAFT_63197 [Dissoconium aciculare CBS 342.82]